MHPPRDPSVPGRSGLRLPALLGAAWIVVGLVAGVLERVGTVGRLGVSPAPALAGLLWVPITFGAVWLARRVRWDDGRRLRFALVHGAAAVAASFVLNALFTAVAVALGWTAPGDALRAALLPAVRWLHLNGGAYLAVVAVVHWVEGRPGSSRPEAPEPALHVERGRGGLRIPFSEILWLQADGDYVRVHTEGSTRLVSRRMKELEAELDEGRFVRVHRSAMVNVGAVREARHRSHGDFEAVLVDGTVVRVSRTRREALLEALGPGPDG